tara:strand:+ start:5422 stop:6429 length:1008 start_codon:yes stop_codon:yes gene_type:complete
MRLSDLGERRILSEIIPKYTTGTGDDCAAVNIKGGYLSVSTDPCPRPAAEVLARDDDPYWFGWLLVTINASDLAAAGASPNCFLAALDLPRDYEVVKFERLLLGVRDSCEANGLDYVGGNIREAASLNATGTAIGTSHVAPLTRTGASAGSRIVVVGRPGRFWSHVKALQNGETLPEDSPLFRPVSQVNEMKLLNDAGLVECAMDTSDGLAPTLQEMCLVNQLTMTVDLEKLRSSCPENGRLIRSERAWMGWGDWSVVISVADERFQEFQNVLVQNKIEAYEIGAFKMGESIVLLEDGDRSAQLGRLESERFASDSWFHKGVEFYQSELEGLVLP